ncbi:RAMP superfamily CRISPR-associated protein [Flavivirga jejuensis]|uniref:RAMP superfamily CRISPR-associated protein n=1 Tax=Flavivirga jejuensis TaxID=870487 RepID=A0ABT8WUT7_9FLAO|nr:RAMP superfamily CRISPR-associated protein [Flavivirga jejuensis]MDO5976942.1 RAMP superfamily CRISPR-associated protein [Flavivirga jejuensis]
MKVELKFYSNWATGTGKTGGSKDSVVIKDNDGLPFIPGRTFKGLVRDAYRACGFTNEISLFGQEIEIDVEIENKKLKEGALRFNSVVVSNALRPKILPYKKHLFTTKTATALSDKQAVNHSLRKNEIVIPIRLTTEIVYNKDNRELNPKDKEEITFALKMLKRVGEKRHRGLGQCIATVIEKSSNNTHKEPENKEEDINADSTIVQFKCTVNSPLILVKKAKTDQNIASLDYIPGNNFRGIVANNLFANKKEESKIDSIVFNGDVHFGDAHLAVDNKRSYKVPYSFYYEKNGKEYEERDTMFNFHLDQKSKKTKQYRKGYLIDTENTGKNIQIQNIKYGNRMKSSRNEETRSSKEKGLFVYHYIEKGQTFIFEIKSDKTEYLKEVTSILNNKTHYFGKSKSAEFGGEVYIEFLEQKPDREPTSTGKYIYAESNLCFINEYGAYTPTPTGEALTGNKEAKIDWTNSQIKYRTYTPYNGHRKNWDAERLIIEKGSVFVLEKEIEIAKHCVGHYNSEGYGNILVNPSFLTTPITIAGIDKEKEKAEDLPNNRELSENEKQFIDYLKNKNAQYVDAVNVHNYVTDSKPDFSSQVSTSQWARVFNATKKADSYSALEKYLFKTDETKDKSICNGGSKAWLKDDTKLLEDYIKGSVKKELDPLNATRQLAKRMIHNTKKQEDVPN